MVSIFKSKINHKYIIMKLDTTKYIIAFNSKDHCFFEIVIFFVFQTLKEVDGQSQRKKQVYQLNNIQYFLLYKKFKKNQHDLIL